MIRARFAGLFACLIFSGAMAATVTVTNPNCPAYSITQSGGDVALTCAGTTTPAPVPAPTPVPVPVPSECPAQTTRMAIDSSFNWMGSLNTGLSRQQSLDHGQSVSYRFIAGDTGAGSFNSIELPGLIAADRYATLTKCPGDFSSVSPANSYCATDGTALYANIKFSVGTDYRGYCTLQPGQTYFLNIRHGRRDRATGAINESCTAGSCGFLIQMLHN